MQEPIGGGEEGGSELAVCDQEGLYPFQSLSSAPLNEDAPGATAGLSQDPGTSTSLPSAPSGPQAELSRGCGRRPGPSLAEGALSPPCVAGYSLMDHDFRGPLGGG